MEELRNVKRFFMLFFLPIFPLSQPASVIYWIFHCIIISIHTAAIFWPLAHVIILKTEDPKMKLEDVIGVTYFFDYVIRSLISLTNYIWFTFSRSQIINLVNQLENQISKMTETSRKSVHRKYCATITLLIILTIMHFLYFVINIMTNFSDLDQDNAKLVSVIVIVNIWAIFAEPLYIATAIFFVFICQLLNGIMDEAVKNTKGLLDSGQYGCDSFIQNLMKEHRTVSKFVVQTDQVFSIFNFLIFSLELCSMVFLFRIYGVAHETFQYQTLLSTIITTVLFSVKCLSAASTNSKVVDMITNNPSFDFDELPPNVSANETYMSLQVKTNFQIYLSRISISPPALTGLQFFTISRGLLLTALGVVITYTLILYENEVN